MAQRDAALAAQTAAETAKTAAEADRNRYKAMVEQLGGEKVAASAKVDQLFEQQTDSMLANWKQGFEAVWKAENPQAIFDSWGSEAAGKVQRSAMAVQLLESSRPGCTVETLALMAGRSLKINQDGTVTVKQP
jgi:hypothetical protein